MLKKDHMRNGAQIKVNAVCKDGVPGNMSIPGSDNTLPFVRVWGNNGCVLGAEEFLPANPGDVLTVLTPPRRLNRTNFVRVRLASGDEGEVFWCELRASCSHI